MFGLFKSQSPKKKLEARYKKVLAGAFKLSSTNRKASDAKHAEAALIAAEIDKLATATGF